jgi:hypothetical protein
MSPTTTLWGGSELGPIGASTHAASLEDEGIGGLGRAAEQ